ncbi:uncharacterized protein stbd1 [Lycodopsis pacificus]
MPLKTGNTVAVERRVDLASLFCMIGRHGPAVALAVIAVVSVVAGLVIYRTVRRKRRKATAAADGDCDGGGPEGDESVIRESHGSVESTAVNDEGSSDVKEDVDLIPSGLRIRHRRAAEETPAPSSPPKSDVLSPDIERVSSDGTEEAAAAAVVCDSHQAEEANGSPQSDACTKAEMVSEDAVDRHRCESGDSIKDVLEEFHDSCLKEPEPINAEDHEQGEEVSTAECQEDEGVTPEKDVFDETRRQEDSFQCASNDSVCFQQTSRMSDNGDEAASSVECNSEEPVIHIEGVSVPSVCCGKDEQFERDNTDGIGFSSFSGEALLAPEGESRNESEEAAEHPLDYLPISEPAEISSSTFQRESNLPPTQQEQRDHAEDDVAAPIRGSDRDEDGGLAGEEVIREDHFNKLIAAKLDATSAQLDEQGAAGVSGLACDQEVGILYDGAEQAKGEMPTGGNDVACSEERGGSSVVLSPAVTCLNVPIKADNHNVALSGTSSVADLSLDCQPPQKEDNTAPSLDEDTNSTILGPQMPLPKTENLPDNNGNGTAVVLAAEERNDQQTIRKEAFDEESVAAVPDSAANVPSVLVDDISCLPLQSICQDQQIDPVEKNETSDETRIDSATDACNTTSGTALSMSEELSPDTQSSSQDQRTDQTTNDKEDFSEVTAAPVLTEDMNPPSCQIDFPSFEHFALRDNDISAAGVGEESGISSMAVSPDAVDECDVIFDEMVLQAVDCDLKPEGQTEAQNDLDDDDVSVIEEDAACMVFGPYPSRPEDMFGHEIKDCYYKMMDQLVAQIADSEKQSDMTVVESEEKQTGGCVDMKEATKAEKEKEDYEKTEISIMEATMDHNEWIMDSNYQAFPWMNLSAASFAPDDTKNNQFPTEECQYSSAAADSRCTDTTDIPPSAEVLQAGTLSLVDEDIQNVQPMPQNVNVTFRVHYFTQTPYQTVAVTGNQRELGNWKGFVLLERAKDGHWATAVSLPAESHVEWKFVVVDKGEVCRWEECGNRLLDTASGDELLVHKCWARW